MEMESVLTKLFDFQSFARNPTLQRIIDQVEVRYGIPTVTDLSDAELSQLAAAGDPFLREAQGEKEDQCL